MVIETDNCDLILLNIGFAEHYADWNYKNVNSPYARIFLAKDGNAKIHFPEVKQELKPGNLYIIPPFTQHRYECDSYFSLYYIHVYENPTSRFRYLEEYIFPYEIAANSLDMQLIERLYEINPQRELQQYNPAYYDNSSTLIRNISQNTRNPHYISIETKGILSQLFSRFMKDALLKQEIKDDRIRKVVRFIRKNMDNSIHMDELSSICCLSKDHFIRLFKREMNVTPVQYINQKKIEKAQLLILTGNQSIKDIALGLSFENISYFNRLFKRYTGCIPTEYKEMNW